MIAEQRRRAYLEAMQISTWLPRTELPFAAASRPELLVVFEPEPAPAALEPPKPVAPIALAQPQMVPERPRVEVPRPVVRVQPAAESTPPVTEPEVPALRVQLAPPRFALQLLRAGDCAVLVELPTGEPFQSRDPAYILLKDLLRAAGLPDSPQLIGEPVRWPLLVRGSVDQGPDAACEFVQSFVAARLEGQPCACVWLVGLAAIRYAGQGSEDSYNLESQVDGLGACWALPGLELLMDEPLRKRALWQAMQRVRQRWLAAPSD